MRQRYSKNLPALIDNLAPKGRVHTRERDVAKGRGDSCMTTKSFIKIFLVKESAIPPFLCLLFDGTRDPALGIYMR